MKKRFLTLGLVVAGIAQGADDTVFTKTVRPFLSQYCLGCHNETLKTANLNFQAWTTGEEAAKHPEVWNKTLDKLTLGQMPPGGLPVAGKAQLPAVKS